MISLIRMKYLLIPKWICKLSQNYININHIDTELFISFEYLIKIKPNPLETLPSTSASILQIKLLFFSPFKGLYYDIKRKLPWYWSDYKDGIHIQALAAFVYVFLGTFTPNVTFGGLLGQATDQYMVCPEKQNKITQQSKCCIYQYLNS